MEVQDATDALIEHNIVFDNATGMRITQSASSNTISNNEVFGNTGDGISLDMAASDNTIRLNSISSNGNDGVSVLDTAGTGNVIEDNFILMNGDDDIDNDDAAGDLIVTNNICEVEEGAPAPGDYCPVAVTNFDIDHF